MKIKMSKVKEGAVRFVNVKSAGDYVAEGWTYVNASEYGGSRDERVEAGVSLVLMRKPAPKENPTVVQEKTPKQK